MDKVCETAPTALPDEEWSGRSRNKIVEEAGRGRPLFLLSL